MSVIKEEMIAAVLLTDLQILNLDGIYSLEINDTKTIVIYT